MKLLNKHSIDTLRNWGVIVPLSMCIPCLADYSVDCIEKTQRDGKTVAVSVLFDFDGRKAHAFVSDVTAFEQSDESAKEVLTKLAADTKRRMDAAAEERAKTVKVSVPKTDIARMAPSKAEVDAEIAKGK